MIHITKVVSKSIIEDFIAKVQNFFGWNLKAYEEMIDKGMAQIKDELEERDISLKWHRIEITQLTNGAVAIMLYGDEK